MKTKSIIISTVFICLLPICSLMAECINSENQPEEIFTMLKNYTLYATSKDEINGIYEICFNPSTPLSKNDTVKKNFIINVPSNHKLTIKGLNFPDPQDPNPPNMQAQDALLILSGSNITLDNVTLMGNDQGTAIQVNGTNMAVKNSTIEKFEKGIVVGENGSVKLSKNTYSLILEKNIYNGAVTSPINKAGKYLNKDDPSKVDYIVGEMSVTTCSANIGSVEMYVISEAFVDLIKNLKYHNTAKCSTPAFLAEDVTLEYADKHKETLIAGTCAFKCENLGDGLEKAITFTYTTANGVTNDFAPMPVQKYVDLPDVISVMGPLSIPSTVSEADGTTIIVADNTGDTTTLGEVPAGTGANIDGGGGTGGPKGGASGGGDSSDDGATVGPGTSGCSVAGAMGATAGPINGATTTIPFLFALLGLVPIGWRKFKKQF